MKKLLTNEEHIVKVGKIEYTKDGSGFIVKDSETRGKYKYGTLTPIDFTSYKLMEYCFLKMGLEDYIQMEYDGDRKTAIVRCIVEEDE